MNPILKVVFINLYDCKEKIFFQPAEKFRFSSSVARVKVIVLILLDTITLQNAQAGSGSSFEGKMFGHKDIFNIQYSCAS